MMRTVDGYLSRIAAQSWPGAVVYREGPYDDPRWVLERPDAEPLGLGTAGFEDARVALRHLARAPTG